MKEVFIEKSHKLLRIAIKENNTLVYCRFYEEDNKPKVGEIYLGVIKKIVPAMKCAFIDLGCDRNAYLDLDKHKAKIKNGDEILVEVLKEEIGDKGAKVTSKVTMGGDYLIVGDFGTGIRMSKSIEDNEFIKEVKKKIKAPKDMAVTIRTKAVEKTIGFIEGEMELLSNNFREIKKRGTFTKGPKILYKPEKALREVLLDLDIDDRVYCNDKDELEDINKIISDLHKRKDGYIGIVSSLHEGDINLFHYYGLDNEILSLRNRKIELKSKGCIILDKTEAMNVIDVNSGNSIEGIDVEENILKINLEAATEICKQIQLRDLSGIIVIDFIDVFNEKQKNEIIKTLKLGLKNDRNKIKVYDFTELSLVQITRERRGKSILEYIEEEVGNQFYSIKAVKKDYLKFLIKNELLRVCRGSCFENLEVHINKIYYFDLRDNIEDLESYMANKNLCIKVVFDDIELFSVNPAIFN
ncbi:MAG: ribonuclease E/G [Clostridium sp.]